MKSKELEKSRLYYSVSEVLEFLNIEEHVLLYWETEFKDLNPNISVLKKRAYDMYSIYLLIFIKKLFYKYEYTLDEAKEKMKEFKKNESYYSGDQKDILKELAKEIKENSY